MSANHHYKVLTSAYDKEFLIGLGEKNGVNWSRSDHEGVNWMRFSNALNNHLANGGDLSTDGDDDTQALQQMLDQYSSIRETHKKSMVPYLRSAMAKLHSDRGSMGDTNPMDLLSDAYKHLDANGGTIWLEKINTLRALNSHISKIQSRLGSTQPAPEQK